MTSAGREVLAFIEKNQPIASGAIQDCFPHWDTESILERLASSGLVSWEPRPTIQGSRRFYSKVSQTEPAEVGNET